MPKPIPGQQYTVGDEDSLSQISLRAYGDAQYWPRIFAANQTTLRSGNPDTIFPGEILRIPLISERQLLKTEISDQELSGKEPDDMTLVLDGLEVPLRAGKGIRTIDTVADGWTGSLAWEPGENPELDKRILPYGYTPAALYLGGKLVVNGLLYSVESQISGGGTIKNLEGWSFTADLMDSTLKPPYEKNGFTLKQRIEELIKPIGISAIFETDAGGPFDRITASKSDTIFSHLNKLASQRSVLLSSTVNGDLLVTKTASGSPVATLEEGQQGVSNFRARFDGRKRFNAYRAIGKSPAGNKVGITKDEKVPRSRFMTFNANETTDGDIQKAADWKRSKQLADALAIPIPVDSWYDPEGNLWKENTLVTLISPSIHVPDGFDFLIRSVEYTFEAGGTSAILNLVPPQVYTGEELIEPWN
jgi:prophage tail gpP-like protein